MPRGGPRPGAGRKPGSRNRKTKAQIEAVKSSGITPLDYLLNLMRNEKADDDDRLEAAKAAAPYVHPKLSSVEMNASIGVSHEDALDELE